MRGMKLHVTEPIAIHCISRSSHKDLLACNCVADLTLFDVPNCNGDNLYM